jgi:hypothetical protein
MDTVIYEKINTVSFAANDKEVSEGKLRGLTTNDSLNVRRLLSEITLMVQQFINIVGVCSFFILSFGWTFPAILVIVGIVRKVEEYLYKL